MAASSSTSSSASSPSSPSSSSSIFSIPKAPPFSLTANRYDLNTFMGRLLHFINVTDPRTLLYSDNLIDEAKQVLKGYENTGKICQSEEYMWHCRKLVDAAIHPATGDIIPKPFRVSAIAPVNIPIVFGMLLCPATNVPGTMALHWLNQSYNTACNYANRSGAEQTTESIAKAYVLATSSACTIAYGLGKVIRSPLLSFAIPFFATSAANVSNICFTRMDEMVQGAPVKDMNGEVRGVSKIAGIQGVMQSAVTRCVLVPFSCLCLPPLAMGLFSKLRIVPSNPRLKIILELGVIYTSLQAALPAALAVFPQTASFKVEDLEPEFRNLRDKAGVPITVLYANKGL